MEVKTFAIAVVCLLFGVWMGFRLEKRDTASLAPYIVKQAVQKPIDTHPLGGCQQGVGVRQVRDSDLPTGPLYLTYQGRTIGIEYQLTQDELDAKKQWSLLPLQEATFNAMELVFVETGDDGQRLPHYDLRLFTITPGEQKEITCRS